MDRTADVFGRDFIQFLVGFVSIAQFQPSLGGADEAAGGWGKGFYSEWTMRRYTVIKAFPRWTPEFVLVGKVFVSTNYIIVRIPWFDPDGLALSFCKRENLQNHSDI